MEDWFIFVIVIEYIFYYVARKIMAKYYILALVGMNLVLAVVFIIQQRADRYINSMWLFLFGIILSIYKGIFIRLLRERYYEVVIASAAIFLMMGRYLPSIKVHCGQNHFRDGALHFAYMYNA